jgi:Uma2 family endonuclease
MVTAKHPLTYDDLLEMPDDGLRREVIGGDLFVTPAPPAGHQNVVGNLYMPLRAYVSTNGGQVYLAPFDVALGQHDIVEPDLLYLSASRPLIEEDQHVIRGAPDLVVEVASPGTGLVDRTRKMELYAAAGVPEYWVADPMRRAIVVNVLDGEKYLAVEPEDDGCITSRELPGLRVNPDEVFARPAVTGGHEQI